MAKHAKPAVTSTLASQGARGAAALAMTSFGFLATSPAAFAGGDDGSATPTARASGACVDTGFRTPLGVATCLMQPQAAQLSTGIDMKAGIPGLAVLSSSDTRSLSPQSVTGACIVGFGLLGDSETHSASDPTGTTNSSRADGVLPTTVTEATFVAPPTSEQPKPPVGAAFSGATAPVGQTYSSSMVTRDDTHSEAYGPLKATGQAHTIEREASEDGVTGIGDY
ncbi:MAG: hypothetical protein GEU83_08010 [Pseudonocardiaceae bacterium]|nr:hypothetical protein [Pseudonocardiaceae bacterium]